MPFPGEMGPMDGPMGSGPGAMAPMTGPMMAPLEPPMPMDTFGFADPFADPFAADPFAADPFGGDAFGDPFGGNMFDNLLDAASSDIADRGMDFGPTEFEFDPNDMSSIDRLLPAIENSNEKEEIIVTGISCHDQITVSYTHLTLPTKRIV